MTITARKGRVFCKAYGLKDLSGIDGNPPGTFEAIVAVFGNVDYGGDRIVLGAFEKTLRKWADSGDPIPVIFSHQWDNLDAMIGEVVEAKELAPGDSALPPELALNGGLWTKFLLEVDEDFAGRVAKKLTARTLKEFSFAYDVPPGGEKRASDGANDLIELDLIEVGPTLKGMNPATVLLARKAIENGGQVDAEWFVNGVIDNLKELGEAGDDEAKELADRLSKGIIAHAFASSDEDATRCVLCGLTRNTVGHNSNAALPSGAKAWVTITGSFEETQEEVYEAAAAWAQAGNVGEGGYYMTYLEATFPDRVVVMVEGWSDPCGDGDYYELDYTMTPDGEAEVSNPRLVGLEVATVAKARAMKHRARPGHPGEKIRLAAAAPVERDAKSATETVDLLVGLMELGG